jgi:hypothetical protein
LTCSSYLHSAARRRRRRTPGVNCIRLGRRLA